MAQYTVTIEATVAKNIWANEEDFRIVSTSLVDGRKLTVKGTFPKLVEGIKYEFTGRYVESPQYGRQFEVQSVSFQAPIEHRDAVIAIPRISKMTVSQFERLWKAHPDVRELVSMSALEMAQVAKVEPARAEQWKTRLSVFLGREAMISALCAIFAGCAIPQTSILQCIDKFGGNCVELILQRPWRLLQIDGIGFSRADAVYLKHGGREDALKRQTLAIAYQIGENESTWVETGEAMEAASATIGREADARALQLGIRAGLFELDNDNLMTLAVRARQEREVAMHVADRARSTMNITGIGSTGRLSQHQRDECEKMLASRFSLLLGGPGTGKTYVAGEVIRAFLEQGYLPQNVAVVAPTGKAAVRLTESMAASGLDITAKTIHSFVGVGGTDASGELQLKREQTETHAQTHLCIIDEGSMVTLSLLAGLLYVLNPECCVIMIGDPGQLPPIGHGAPLRDLMWTPVVSRGHLLEVQRNGGAIVTTCADIAKGLPYLPNPQPGDNVQHIESDQAGIAEIILGIFRDLPPGCSANDVQVIAPMKKREAVVGTFQLNQKIRSIVNPNAEGKIAVGDKVYCKSNSELPYAIEVSPGQFTASKPKSSSHEAFVANGEFGTVVFVSDATVPDDEQFAAVLMDSPTRIVAFYQKSLLDFGWAVTIHKSQGSEWPYVLIVGDTSGNRMGSRQMIYTALSRARKMAITIGQKQAINSQCRSDILLARRTKLREEINARLNRSNVPTKPAQQQACLDL